MNSIKSLNEDGKLYIFADGSCMYSENYVLSVYVKNNLFIEAIDDENEVEGKYRSHCIISRNYLEVNYLLPLTNMHNIVK